MNFRIIAGINHLACRMISELVQDIHINPVFALAFNQAGIIRRVKIANILTMRIYFIACDLIQSITLFKHSGRLGKELPILRCDQCQLILFRHPIRRLDLASHDRPPVFLIRRIGIHDQARECATAIFDGRKAPQSRCCCINDCLWHLAGFVHPGASQFKRQELFDILRLIKRQKYNFHLNIIDLNHMNERRRPRKMTKVLFRKPLKPSFSGGQFQFRKCVSDNSVARPTFTGRIRRLSSGTAE